MPWLRSTSRAEVHSRTALGICSDISVLYAAATMPGLRSGCRDCSLEYWQKSTYNELRLVSERVVEIAQHAGGRKAVQVILALCIFCGIDGGSVGA